MSAEWVRLGAGKNLASGASLAEPETLDDWALLTATKEGFAGLDILFERHRDYVFRLAWGFVGQQELAEDVTQEVFLRLARARDRAHPRAQFRTWLYQVTLNTSRELRRKKKEINLEESSDLDHHSTPTAPPDERLLDLERALDQLSERQREALILRYFEGLSTRETADVMGCRQGTLKSHLHRAVELLRSFMGSKASLE